MSEYCYQHKGFTIRIEREENPQNPREEWDNVTNMICFHRRYILGDKNHNYNVDDYANWEQLKDAIIKQEDVVQILPIYMYGHSGITIKTTPFNCPWDSGQIGFIWITRKSVLENFGWKRLTKKRIIELENTLIQDVAIYDAYLTGDVYGYVIVGPDEKPTEHSCWGIYGDSEIKEDGCVVNEARYIINNLMSRSELQND
jgi:hypothetical protein